MCYEVGRQVFGLPPFRLLLLESASSYTQSTHCGFVAG